MTERHIKEVGLSYRVLASWCSETEHTPSSGSGDLHRYKCKPLFGSSRRQRVRGCQTGRLSVRQISMKSVFCASKMAWLFDIPRSLGAPAVLSPSPGRRRRAPSLPRARGPTQESLSFWATTVSLVGYDQIGVSLASGSGNRRRRVGVAAASPLSTRLRPPRLGLYGTVDGAGNTLRSGSPHSY